MIKASFPDLQGIDVQGNTRLNCSDLVHLHKDIPVLSDCDNEKPLQCDNLDKVREKDLKNRKNNSTTKFQRKAKIFDFWFFFLIMGNQGK